MTKICDIKNNNISSDVIIVPDNNLDLSGKILTHLESVVCNSQVEEKISLIVFFTRLNQFWQKKY